MTPSVSPYAPPLVSEFADDPDMKELIETFVAELPARVAAMRQAWESGHMDLLRRLAHQLHGAAGGYGFAPIGDVAARIEICVRQRSGGAGDPATHERLRQELDTLAGLCARARSV